MLIADLLKLKPGQLLFRQGVAQTVDRVQIVPYARANNQEKGSEIIDLSYAELVYYDFNNRVSALYAGPPIRMALELPEFSLR